MRCNVGVGRKLKVLHTRQFHQNGHHHTCRETAGVKAKYFFHFSQCTASDELLFGDISRDRYCVADIHRPIPRSFCPRKCLAPRTSAEAYDLFCRCDFDLQKLKLLLRLRRRKLNPGLRVPQYLFGTRTVVL